MYALHVDSNMYGEEIDFHSTELRSFNLKAFAHYA